MRQVFFLLAAAMIVAFGLSWATSEPSSETEFAVPDHVLIPDGLSVQEPLEISAVITLNDSCESIESVEQEVQEQKVIFSIRLQTTPNHLCRQQVRSNISVNLPIEKFKIDPSRRVDIYFRQDESTVKFFGSVELKENLLTQN